jgi:hypothetical protein
MVHGTEDEPDGSLDASTEHFSWEETYAEARRVNGNTANAPSKSAYATCGESYQVRLKVASGGRAPSARYEVEGMAHEWLSRDSCHTDDLVIERFAAFGLGAPVRP